MNVIYKTIVTVFMQGPGSCYWTGFSRRTLPWMYNIQRANLQRWVCTVQAWGGNSRITYLIYIKIWTYYNVNFTILSWILVAIDLFQAGSRNSPPERKMSEEIERQVAGEEAEPLWFREIKHHDEDSGMCIFMQIWLELEILKWKDQIWKLAGIELWSLLEKIGLIATLGSYTL